MKKRVLFLVCLMASCIALLAQVKKPVFMVFPSDAYCTTHGYTFQLQTADGSQTMPDYVRCANEDKDMTSAINTVAEMLVERGMPVKDMAHTVKMMAGKAAEEGTTSDKPLYDKILEAAEVDIVIMLDIGIKEEKPMKSVTVVMTGITADTGDIIASTTESSHPFVGGTVNDAIKECLIFGMDKFSDQLLRYFMSKAQ